MLNNFVFNIIQAEYIYILFPLHFFASADINLQPGVCLYLDGRQV